MSDKIRKLLSQAQKDNKLTIPQEEKDKYYTPSPLDDKFRDGVFFNLALERIKPDHNQPRKYFDPDALEELAESIKQKGVLQPVIVRVDKQEQFYLVAGERRYRAAKIAGLKKLPAIVTKGNPMEIALIENLQRDDLKPLEEAEALGKMIEEHNYTHEQLALAIGKDRTTITKTLILNKLPEIIKKEVRESRDYPKRLLIEIAQRKTEEEMIRLFTVVKVENLTSEQVKEKKRKEAGRTSRPKSEVALDKMITFQRYLGRLRLQSLDENDRLKIIDKLHTIRRSIEEILQE